MRASQQAYVIEKDIHLSVSLRFRSASYLPGTYKHLWHQLLYNWLNRKIQYTKS